MPTRVTSSKTGVVAMQIAVYYSNCIIATPLRDPTPVQMLSDPRGNT